MNEKITKRIFITLFALLYMSVALVSTYHAVAFFGLANVSWIAVMLAITFEIGQAAVLFSILTNATGKRKILPWFLMITLTLVQVLGNVYSSYKYLITNSESLLRYFKEPIFVWMELPDAQANVILTYIIGAILPIVSLLMTGMVTSYLGKSEQDTVPEKNVEKEPEPVNEPINEPVNEQVNDNKSDTLKEVLMSLVDDKDVDKSENKQVEEPTEVHVEEPVEVPTVEPEQITEEPIEEPVKEELQRKSHFINMNK